MLLPYSLSLSRVLPRVDGGPKTVHVGDARDQKDESSSFRGGIAHKLEATHGTVQLWTELLRAAAIARHD